ncbi:MAG TPA: TetR/AcrR family transcriptional regulator [Candidatus Binatia bacterium]
MSSGGDPVARSRSARAAPRKPRGSPRTKAWKQDPQGRRDRVVEEATRLFLQHGYANVSTADIARAAGVAEGTVFHYFGSKSALLGAVAEHYGEQFAAAMFAGLDPVAAQATVTAIVERAFDFVAGQWPGFGHFLLADSQAAAEKGDASGSTSAPLARSANRVAVTRRVESVLEQWQRQRLLSGLDPPVTADLLFGIMEAALRGWMLSGLAHARERYAAATVAAMSRILGIDVVSPAED